MNDTLLRARTSFQSHLMKYRPNSASERTGTFMTGTVVDSSVRGQRSCDIAPDTNRECCIERFITKRAQRLKDDRENLKDRLHRCIELRSIQKRNPPKHPSYNLFAARLKSFATWPRQTELPTPESLAEAGFFSDGMSTLFYITFITSSIVIFVVLLISHLSLEVMAMILLAFIAGWVYANGSQGIFLSRNMPAGHSPVSTYTI